MINQETALVIGGSKGFGKCIRDDLENRGINTYTAQRTTPTERDYILDVSNECSFRVKEVIDDIKQINEINQISYLFCVPGYAIDSSNLNDSFAKKRLDLYFNMNLRYVLSTLATHTPNTLITFGSKWQFEPTSNEGLSLYGGMKNTLYQTCNTISFNQNFRYIHFIVPTMDTPGYHRSGFDRNTSYTQQFNVHQPSEVSDKLMKLVFETEHSGIYNFYDD